ncbi:nostrin isoform X2 [Megachile rotundata]|uniref:nostrin isoform X2 n=1 Tax=Megachile rotundata TaxID=143995 RepID=UPI003FD21A01
MEARHAWASLKSIRKLSSSLSNGNSDANGGSTTTWYDAPVPVIIHCHEFPDATDRSEIVSMERRASEAEEEEKDEARRTSREQVASEEKREDTGREGGEKRHRSTVELTAVASVKTDEDGLPEISFSFLHANLDRCSFGEETAPSRSIDSATVTATSTATVTDNLLEHRRTSTQNRPYDFPNGLRVPDEIETEKVVESRCAAEAPRDQTRGIPTTRRESDDADINALEDTAERNTDRYDRAKRLVRSLKLGRKRYGESESDGEDAGIPTISGSYSDPECSNDVSANVSPRWKNGHSKKHRLGKAWEKMRSWLRDETSKINEVVNKHARLQAVGALTGEARVPVISKSNSASYDLTKASTQQLGSITKVEEFGLTSVTEENATRPSENDDIALVNATSDASKNASKNASNNLRRVVGSSDNVFDEDAKEKIVTSYSVDKLCFDTEHEETVGIENSRDHARKAGLIKRRMLGSIRGLMASTHLLHVHEPEEGGQGGFEDVRRYVKQGGDFCKELASILHERAELEATYAKGLSKLSIKLTKACAKDQGGNSSGGVNEAWRCVGEEMEAAAEAHRIWGLTLGEQLAKPLRVGVAEAQGRSRKSIENSVDKAGKSLHEWRNVAMKSKKQSFACARENERLQDLARLQSISQSQQSNNKSSNHHMTEKEASKLEARRRKAEDSSRRADTEFYTVSVRAERARLEYESTMRKGAKQMELLEEERLSALKDLANVYLAHLQALAPRLQQSADRLAAPVRNCNVSQDIEILKNLIRRVESNDGCNSDQLLPDFYAEHITLAMNRERRKQALVRVLHLIRQDLDRERRGREGLETLHRAFVATPAFAADESTQNVTDKLHHMRSMLLYLEAARYKVGGTLAEVEGSKRSKHPLAEHILVSRDKQGLQQSVLKIPSWAKNESFEIQDDEDEIEVHLSKTDHDTDSRHWPDRTAGDGNSENPPDEDDFSDFDEFSSHSEDNNNQDVDATETTSKSEGTEQCRAIYQYSANLNDELSLSPGDLITVHQKQPDGWWIGECRGRTGIFPATYVQVIH